MHYHSNFPMQPQCWTIKGFNLNLVGLHHPSCNAKSVKAMTYDGLKLFLSNTPCLLISHVASNKSLKTPIPGNRSTAILYNTSHTIILSGRFQNRWKVKSLHMTPNLATPFYGTFIHLFSSLILINLSTKTLNNNLYP